jgi:hypothetical protein
MCITSAREFYGSPVAGYFGERVRRLAWWLVDVYIVHMNSYSVASARQHMAKVLDAAENGLEVSIIRRGVRFRMVVDRTPKPLATPEAFVEIVDASLLEHGWHWESGPEGDLVLSLADSGASPPKRGVKPRTGKAASKPRARKPALGRAK